MHRKSHIFNKVFVIRHKQESLNTKPAISLYQYHFKCFVYNHFNHCYYHWPFKGYQ